MAGQAQSQTVIKFSTEDGMSIYGTLYLPQSVSRPVAGVILFAEPQWIVRSTLEAYGRDLAGKHGMAALTLDFRGNGQSVNGKLFEHFSAEETAGLQLDVRAGIQFLSSPKMVDPKRIGLVAVGIFNPARQSEPRP